MPNYLELYALHDSAVVMAHMAPQSAKVPQTVKKTAVAA